uniref:Tetraspanin 10 n=1 Tax=Gasterosteus aculeatus aculeatus TaxID=481459 RepID=A0AAQ4RKX9_GASAC
MHEKSEILKLPFTIRPWWFIQVKPEVSSAHSPVLLCVDTSHSIGTDPMLVFLTAGSVLTLLCLSGCVGALRENRTLLKLFSSNLQCCGADNYRDWELNIYYNCSAPGVLACGVPATCCVDPLENGTVWNSQCGLGAQLLDEFSAQSVIFLGGCLGGISRWIEQHEGLIGTVAIVVVGVQILTLFITSRLLESIRWHNVYT